MTTKYYLKKQCESALLDFAEQFYLNSNLNENTCSMVYPDNRLNCPDTPLIGRFQSLLSKKEPVKRTIGDVNCIDEW